MSAWPRVGTSPWDQAACYDPRYLAEGRYTVESRLLLFPGTGQTEYGVFVGGKELDGPARKWVAFVVRRDGSAAILRHENGRTESVLSWAKHAGVKPHLGGDETVGNTIRIAVDTAVVFQVNDSTVATLPRARLDANGSFGFRIGSGLNLHITSLNATHRLAPVPRGR